MENDTEVKRLVLGEVVTEISQDENRVKVTTDKGHEYVAEQVIVTFSLGVLQDRSVTFEPDLPAWKWDSIFGFQVSHYLQIYFRFPSGFWDDVYYILNADDNKGHFPLWINFNKFQPGSNILQALVVDAEAERLLTLSEALIQQEAMAVLKTMYGDSIPDPDEISYFSFGSDPLFKGSFTAWPPGYSMMSHQSLMASVDRVHFAGDYASDRYSGYLHGAYLSGESTAKRVMGCMEKDCPAYMPPMRGCTYKEADNYKKGAKMDDGSCTFPPRSGGAATITGSILVTVVMLMSLFLW